MQPLSTSRVIRCRTPVRLSRWPNPHPTWEESTETRYTPPGDQRELDVLTTYSRTGRGRLECRVGPIPTQHGKSLQELTVPHQTTRGVLDILTTYSRTFGIGSTSNRDNAPTRGKCPPLRSPVSSGDLANASYVEVKLLDAGREAV